MTRQDWNAALVMVDRWAAASPDGRDGRQELTAELRRLGLDDGSVAMLLGHHDARRELVCELRQLGAGEDDIPILLDTAEAAYS